jgi:hypothetical protein
MKKDNIEHSFLKYTGLAAAALGTSALSGQAVWTDIPDTTLDANGAFYDLNLDNDTSGVIDFRITQLVDSGLTRVSGVILSTGDNATNQAMGVNMANYAYPFNLNVGDSIGPNEIFRGINLAKNIGYMAFEIDGTTYPSSQFVDTANGITDGFLGLRFTAFVNDTNRTYYGWARVDVAADLKSITIKDYGHMPIEEQGLTAGENSPIGMQENGLPKIEMVQRGMELHIELPEGFTKSGTVEVYDLSGRKVDAFQISDQKTSLPLRDLPRGILVAKLNTNGMEASRKLVIR